MPKAKRALAGSAPRWLLDELTCAGRENLDVGHVARYDGKEDAAAASEVALLDRFGLNRDSVVIEFGPGTGQFTVEVALRCGRVLAVDVSKPMLAALEGKVATLGLSNVEVLPAGFLTYEHTAAPADFFYSRYALHHLPDFWKALALAKIRGMLRLDGHLRALRPACLLIVDRGPLVHQIPAAQPVCSRRRRDDQLARPSAWNSIRYTSVSSSIGPACAARSRSVSRSGSPARRMSSAVIAAKGTSSTLSTSISPGPTR